jgi:hypothetical protein
MSEPTLTPTPAPADGTVTPVPAAGDAPAALVKPDFLPADYWDEKAGIKTDEFAKHYGELTVAQQKLAERAAAVPEKPEGYKIEIKLPDDVKVPEGLKFDPSKDPRLPVLLKTAHELGLSNADVNKLVTLDAQFALQNHAAEAARVAEETKKLGEKAADRIAAATNWTKALAEKGDFSADEVGEIRAMASTAAGVTALEKLMAKVNGGIPGHVPTPPTKPTEQPLTDRWYGGTQQKVS